MLRITPAHQEDIPTIQFIAKNTWPNTFGHILSTEQITYMLDMMYSDAAIIKQMTELQHKYILILEDEKPAGYAAYEINYKGTPVIKLHKIYVLPEMQGKKAGQLLMDEVCEIGRIAHQDYISLNVNRDNRAIKFYEKVGFEKVGEEDIDIGNGFFMNDAIMQRKL
ncbi:L-amino acid N-acyltransferase YncA [Chitinophaga skermanii]|uniref:L-amino acid N-acyltransferase YncA n=1 Tax=Chitinophaga skermanii TaxID=331697 RepID=A0A327Q2N0_9BACT|nr:GNAT family N-acetyltransferase [Chitinophaga skermanii]RAI98678.1 L-amino acid N-acyltransferase YncA [Chitinophaga skermanii]